MKYFGLSRLGVWGVAVLLLGAFAIARTPEGGYHLLKKYELGTAPGAKNTGTTSHSTLPRVVSTSRTTRK
jgi:hypothetical protein